MGRIVGGEVNEIYSRVCGYHRPVKNWNKGKKAEFRDRKTFDENKATNPKRFAHERQG